MKNYWGGMKNYWGGMGDIQKLSGLDEKVYEAVDLDKPDWKYVRTLSPEVQKKIREAWEENNPHKEANLNPESYIEEKLASAKSMLKEHAKKWTCSDRSFNVQWKDDWKIHRSWNSMSKKDVLDGDGLGSFEFVEAAFEDGYFPESVNNPNEVEDMTDKDILIKKMNLSEKEAEYVLMMKEAQPHLRKLERIRNGW